MVTPRIPAPDPPPLGVPSEYFRRRIAEERDLPTLPPADAPCRDANGAADCAIVCGLYTEIAHDLAKCPEDVQLAYVRRWDCHNDRRRACRGAVDLLAVLRSR